MSREEVYQTLTDVFREVFDKEDLTIYETTSAKDIEEWDSLRHITLMSAVEEAFDITMDMRDIVHLKAVGELVDVILRES